MGKKVIDAGEKGRFHRLVIKNQEN
jgi:hypothetical protein